VVTLLQPGGADASGGHKQKNRRKDSADRRSENAGSLATPPSRISVFSTSAAESSVSWLGPVIFYAVALINF
jgi:hypothetical protein